MRPPTFRVCIYMYDYRNYLLVIRLRYTVRVILDIINMMSEYANTVRHIIDKISA